MKISELNSKTFLGAPGAATHSYVLVNYEDNTTNEPVTYKATLDELGKSIASNLKLFKSSSSLNMNDAACLLDVNNEAYSERKAYPMVSQSEIDMIHAAQSEGDVNDKITDVVVDGGYVYYNTNGLSNNEGVIPYVVTYNPYSSMLQYYDPVKEDFIEFGDQIVIPSESAAPSESVAPSESEP